MMRMYRRVHFSEAMARGVGFELKRYKGRRISPEHLDKILSKMDALWQHELLTMGKIKGWLDILEEGGTI